MSPKIPIVISFIMHIIGTIIYLDIHILKLKNPVVLNQANSFIEEGSVLVEGASYTGN